MDHAIKILYTGLGDAGHIGGIEAFILKTVTHIDREKFQIDLLVSPRRGQTPAYYTELQALGCRFHFVPHRRDGFVQNRRALRVLFDREGYEIVHCFLNSLSYVTPALEAAGHGCQTILNSRNSQCPRSVVTRALHSVNRLRLSGKDVVRLAVSEEAGEWMFGARPFIVLGNGVDLDRFRFSNVWREEIRREFALGERTVILHTGAFRPQKNHEFLLRVFAESLQSLPGAVLLLAGSGELLESVKERARRLGIADHVIFAGARRDVERLLSAADVYLFPSLYEGFPNALIEAEASGLRCVAADTITPEAALPELCARLSLDAPLAAWVRATREPASIRREEAPALLARRGFGVREQVRKLEELYSTLAGGERRRTIAPVHGKADTL